ncbi:MAG: hypothetical protein HRF44_09525 [Ignavibacterium sp.]|jgi:hypothetical protein
MAYVKETACKKCGKKFFWKIERPGDGFWDRWRNDDGNILASWFLSNSLCWDHAFEAMPERFRAIIHTIAYHEENGGGTGLTAG